MEHLRVLIVDDDPYVTSGCSAMLQVLGHEVVGCASGGKEAVEKAAALTPGLVLMDLRLDDMDGLEASFRILQQRPLPIVIMTALSEPGLMEKAESAGAAGYVVKPFSRKELETALWLAWSRHKQMQTLKNEIGDLQDSLKARKLIERAKGLLMERKRISEAEAYKRMQTMSRNRNIPMMRLAEAIIMTDKLAQNTEQYPQDRGQPVNSTNKRV